MEIRTFDWGTIDLVRPDLVIDEFVERYFTEFPRRCAPRSWIPTPPHSPRSSRFAGPADTAARVPLAA